MLRSEIGLQLWKIMDIKVEIYNSWEMIRDNIKISAKESLGYFELKKHKPLFDEDAQNY
jgi:hypothetical protein